MQAVLRQCFCSAAFFKCRKTRQRMDKIMNDFNLKPRLAKCADFVIGSETVCDVGTDHALLAAELVTKRKIARVIASDIAEGPLTAARATVESLGLSEHIRLVQTDGLDGIEPEGISDVVIAGMGGESIISILERASWLGNGVNLILQPMTRAELLRVWLYENGFRIELEEAVTEDRFIYTVIKARYYGKSIPLLDIAANTGMLDYSLPESRVYLSRRIEQLRKKADGLAASGDRTTSEKINVLIDELMPLAKGRAFVLASTVYRLLDALYPFSYQEKWDNSGFLVGNKSSVVSGILLTLDITNEAVYEADEKGCKLIVSHHPVIFEPLRRLSSDNPVYNLAACGISAICMHTNLDAAKGGMNDVVTELLSQRLDFDDNPEIFCKTPEVGVGIGKILRLRVPIHPSAMAEILKELFGCEIVRFTDNGGYIEKIAVACGSCGSMLETALDAECDALITGDVKHNIWVDAKNYAISLFDCGHFHTENIILEQLDEVLKANLPFIKTYIAKSSADPVQYA